MQDEKQPAKPKNQVTNFCGQAVERPNVNLFVQALTNYFSLQTQMVAKNTPQKPALRSKKIRPYIAGQQ